MLFELASEMNFMGETMEVIWKKNTPSLVINFNSLVFFFLCCRVGVSNFHADHMGKITVKSEFGIGNNG